MTDMEAKQSCEVVIVGTALTDLQVYPVTKSIAEEVSYPAEKMVWTVGGDTLNEATIITRLGHTVRMVSCIGDDVAGDLILRHCRENGIGTAYLKQDGDKRTAIHVGLIWADGERTFINDKGGSVWTCGPEDMDFSALEDGKILSFACIFNNPRLDGTFALDLFRRAKEKGMTICADIVKGKRGETLADIQDALGYIDYFFPNLDEARALTGLEDMDEIADRLLGLGVKHVIMKIGKRGCLVKAKGLRRIVPGYPHSDCIDTTGAGDNFASGFIAGLLEGQDTLGCAELANCTASLAVEAIGATRGVQSREQVDRRLEAYRACFT